MRILLLSNMYPSARRPAYGVFVRNQVEEIRNRYGHEVKLVTSSAAPGGWVGKILKYVRLHFCAWLHAVRRFDIIHLHYASTAHLLAATPILVLRRKPRVITLHRGEVYSLPEEGYRLKIVGYFLRRTDAIIAVSNDLKEKLIHRFLLPSRKIFVIDVGCDLELFAPCLPSEKGKAKEKLGLQVGKFTLLFVGNITHRKGLDILFDSLKNFGRQDEVVVLIIGRGDAQADLSGHDICKVSRCQVAWLGEKRNQELPQWYAAADAFVLPSRSEGTPTVMLEAMASGTPVIASRVGGIPEVIQDGVSGLLFRPEDHNDLKRCLEKLKNDVELRQELAEKALEEVKKHSLGYQVARIVELYRRAIQGKATLTS